MQQRYNLRLGFPAVTTKKLAWKSVVGELLWFLEGSSDERRLAEITFGKPREELIGKKTIWTANADKQGKDLGYPNTDLVKELGPVYGVQWRNWNGDFDQIESIIHQLKNSPESRRIILSAWNVGQIDAMALPPCHTLAQFRVMNGKLSCQLYQRSADMFLGVPFNVASYALLTHILAKLTNLEVGDFIHTIGDAHIYNTHMDQVKILLEREALDSPELVLPEFETLDELLALSVDDFTLSGYNHLPVIKADMAV